MHHFTITKFHNTNGVGCLPLVSDSVFRDPDIALSKNSPHIKTRWLAGMVAAQGLQISPPQNPLARLGVIANNIIVINIMLNIYIANCRSMPVRI